MSCCWIWKVNIYCVPTYQFINAEIRQCRNYWHMYKNTSEIISKDSWQKTVIESRVVVLQKKIFLVLNRRVYFFRAHNFTKVVAANHSSIDRLFLRRALATINCTYPMNLTVYLRRIFISKEHLQPYIWVVPSFFQEATCSDLVFSTVLCFF